MLIALVFLPSQEAAMSSTGNMDSPLSGLSLASMDDPVENNMPALKLHPNSRKKADRRTRGERRLMLRFESDRRSGKTRRPQSSWDNGKAF